MYTQMYHWLYWYFYILVTFAQYLLHTENTAPRRPRNWRHKARPAADNGVSSSVFGAGLASNTVSYSSNMWSVAGNKQLARKNKYWWVVWLPFFIFPYIGLLIIPIDFHIFQRGGPTTNQSSKQQVFEISLHWNSLWDWPHVLTLISLCPCWKKKLPYDIPVIPTRPLSRKACGGTGNWINFYPMVRECFRSRAWSLLYHVTYPNRLLYHVTYPNRLLYHVTYPNRL